jgi:hypothetical protein
MFEKSGYPKPHVNWKETKARAMERFKRDMKAALPELVYSVAEIKDKTSWGTRS